MKEHRYGHRFPDRVRVSFNWSKIFAGSRNGRSSVWTKQTKALGITLLAGTMIPIADMLIVLNKDYNGLTPAIPNHT